MVVSRSIAARSKSKPIELSAKLRFVKLPGPGEPGGPGGPGLGGPVGESATERYFALRYSFIDAGTQKRYSSYQVISCQHPYVLPADNPNMTVMGTTGDEECYTAPTRIILSHQRTLYGNYQEEEYSAKRL